MSRIQTWDLVLALGLGVAAAAARIVLIFFPLLNLTEFIMFLGVGAWLGHRRPQAWWVSAALLFTPALALVALTLQRLGRSNLHEGVGTWHLYSTGVIPIAALLGAGLGAWLAHRAMVGSRGLGV